MRTRSLTSTRGWFGVVAIAATCFIVGPLATPLPAQTAILGELEFKGASKVERSSGVWIDGQYLG